MGPLPTLRAAATAAESLHVLLFLAPRTTISGASNISACVRFLQPVARPTGAEGRGGARRVHLFL